MKNLAFLLGASMALSLSGAEVSGPMFYTFKGSLDRTEWRIEHRVGNDYSKPGGEVQEFTPEAVFVDDQLHLVARDQETIDPRLHVRLSYTGGRINTIRSFLYGKFTFHACLPKGRGYYPALWLRTPLNQGPINGEIDVLESRGSLTTAYQSTRHVWEQGRHISEDGVVAGIYPRQKKFRNVPEAIPRGTDLASGFHDYTVEWRQDFIIWFFDGKPYYTLREQIPQVPMVVVVQLALGGYAEAPDATTPFPASLDIESIRVEP